MERNPRFTRFEDRNIMKHSTCNDVVEDSPVVGSGAARPRINVSVVICAYNYSKFIVKAIRSVQAQTYADWECIVVDDASTDDTAEVVAALAAEDPRIRYFRNARNLGVGASRNLGNSLATGDWIAVLDADDWWAPDKLKFQVEAVQSLPGAVLCCTGFVIVTGTQEQVRCRPDSWSRDLESGLRAHNLILHSSVLIAREALIGASGYDDRLPSAHDWDLYQRLLHRHGSHSFIYIDQPFVYYRVHGNSISANWRRMMSDERRIVGKSLTRGAWAIRHPRGALNVLHAQVYRERTAFESAGRWHGALLSACLLVSLSPFRRWRWRELGRLLVSSSFGAQPGSRSLSKAD